MLVHLRSISAKELRTTHHLATHCTANFACVLNIFCMTIMMTAIIIMTIVRSSLSVHHNEPRPCANTLRHTPWGVSHLLSLLRLSKMRHQAHCVHRFDATVIDIHLACHHPQVTICVNSNVDKARCDCRSLFSKTMLAYCYCEATQKLCDFRLRNRSAHVHTFEQ